jgi:calreticulin
MNYTCGPLTSVHGINGFYGIGYKLNLRIHKMKLLFLTFTAAAATNFFQGDFQTLDSWVQPDGNFGTFQLDNGLWPSEKARHYTMFAPTLPVTQGGNFAVQYSVRLKDTNHACGGAYLKLAQVDSLEDITADTPYHFMFGPDFQCNGQSKVHAIFNKKPDTHWNQSPSANVLKDGNTHAFTFLLFPNNTYAYQVDGETLESGSLEEGWPLLEPATIPDPSIEKPEDWPAPRIADPENPKPEGWDALPEYIVDPDAENPEDWDEEEDGEWEAPTIPNPERQWTPTTIANSEYTQWEHPRIDNPEYVADPNLYQQVSGANAVGFEIWSMDNGVVFGDLLVTDDLDYSLEHLEGILSKGEDEDLDS